MVKCRAGGCRKTARINKDTGLCPKCSLDTLDDSNQDSDHEEVVVDLEKLEEMHVEVAKGNKIDEAEMQRTNLAFQIHVLKALSKKSNDVDEVKKLAENTKLTADNNSEKIKALEDKVGSYDECAIPKSITFQNVTYFSDYDEIHVIKDILRHVRTEGFNPDTDVIKAVRKGYKPASEDKPEKLGTICVELKSADIRSKVMKEKKCLESLPNEGNTSGLRNIRIRNMLSQLEINQQFTNRTLLKMIPGGDKFYIAGNGAMRPVSSNPHPHHLPRQHHQLPPQRPPHRAPHQYHPGNHPHPHLTLPSAPPLPSSQQTPPSSSYHPRPAPYRPAVPLPGLFPPQTGAYAAPPPPQYNYHHGQR